MSKIVPLEDDNPGSEQNNIGSGDEQRRFSLREFSREELQVLVTRTVEQVIEQWEELQVLETRTDKQVIEQLVPLISRAVKQEMELAQKTQNSGRGMHSLESRSLQLKFLDNLSLPVYTGKKIKGEGSTPIRVALFDAITEQVVNSGPEASAKVEIVAVEEDFDGDNRSNWKPEEFNDKISREKLGRKSLLTGNVYLNLKEGIGFVGDISFTNNRIWLQMFKLRLGAKVVDNLNGSRVREAVTKSFVVKDYRNTLREKHRPPFPHDEVWRLDNIAKDGPFHKHLYGENIKTVEDFLIQYNLDPQRLRVILGRTMYAKIWEATVNHARTCILDKRLNLYFSTSSQKKTGVVFNVVGQVTGLLSECHYTHVDKLSETDKANAHELVKSAFQNMKEVLSFDDETCLEHAALNLFNPSNSPTGESPNSSYFEACHTNDGHEHTQTNTSSHTNEVVPCDDDHMSASFHIFNAACPSNPARLENPNGFNCETSHINDGHDCTQPSTSSVGISSFGQSFGGASDLNEYGLHSGEILYPIYDLPWSFPGEVNNPLIFHIESTTKASFEDEHLEYFDTNHSFESQNSNLESQGDLHSIVKSFILARAAAAAVAKAQKRWAKLCSVMKWFSFRKTLALKSVALNSIASEMIQAPKKRRIN